MSKIISNKDLRTFGIVLRRANIGEADRMVNLITPQGKISAIAKSARREKSKLAGGIEMFSVSDYNIHLGKGEVGIITSTKMIEHYSEILKDFSRIELAGFFLKKISVAADQNDSMEYFEILRQCLEGLNEGLNMSLAEAWFLLNIVRASGEEVNLYRDKDGSKLKEGVRYSWNTIENSFVEDSKGSFGTNEIKVLRLIVTQKLKTVSRVKLEPVKLDEILSLAKIVSRM